MELLLANGASVNLSSVSYVIILINFLKCDLQIGLW